MLINNEKYACEACIRGHRVSSCHHNERQLHKVAPKGRPVSQCTHCRSLRKARAQHVRCNCSEKGHSEADCPNKKTDAKPEPSTCCCTHGSRCSCALKKDLHKEHHLDTVPEDAMCDMAIPESFDIRPRSTISTPSESKLTVFANGHHKPVHKHNDAAHIRGLPYTIPRSHTIHGHSETAHRSVDSLPHTKRSLLSQETNHSHESVTSAPQPIRRVKSEHGSPELNPTSNNLTPINTSLSPLDPTYSPFGVLSGTSSPCASGLPYNLPDQVPDSYFGFPSGSTEFETPLYSAGINPPSVDWSTYNLQYESNGEYSAAPSQPPSYASFDLSHMNPGLTSSSGEISETEDFSNISEPPNNLAADLNFDAFDVDPQRLSSASSMMNTPHQANLLSTLKQDSTPPLDIDEFLRQAEERTLQMQEQHNLEHAGSVSSSQYSSSITSPQQLLQQKPLHGLSVREAQNYAHMDGGSEAESSDGGFKPRQPPVRQLSNSSGEDPMWPSPDINSPEDIRWQS